MGNQEIPGKFIYLPVYKHGVYNTLNFDCETDTADRVHNEIHFVVGPNSIVVRTCKQ